MTSVLTSSERPITLIPFSLWTLQGPEADVLANASLPHLRTWLTQSHRVAVDEDRVAAPLLATLSPPHERAWAQALGWPVVDGCLPWAAHAAHATRGPLTQPEGPPASASGWAFITLCHWQVSHGQVMLGDPAHLQIDAATDAELFRAMQPFFEQDGIALFPYQPGQWLAHSPLLADLPTASIDRVMGRNIDPWLVGSEAQQDTVAALSPAAKLLRRLQNEMQMMLYTHPVNASRRLSINSFWVHGTGPWQPTSPNRQDPSLCHALRPSALQQDVMGWLEAWQQVDAQVIAPLLARVAAGEPQRLVLSGDHAFHVYDSAAPSWWQRVRQRFAPPALDHVLALAPLKD